MYWRNNDVNFCSLPICRGARPEIVHKMPINARRREEWLAVLNDYRDRLEKIHVPFICGRHFRPEDYLHAESRKLNRVAVPSLNIKELNQLDICKKVKIYTEDQNAVEEYKNDNTLQSKPWAKAKRKNLLSAKETERKRIKLNITDVTQIVDDEQNEYVTIDELKTSPLGWYDQIEVHEQNEDEEEKEPDEKNEELYEKDGEFDEELEKEPTETIALIRDPANEYEEMLLVTNSEIATKEWTIGEASVPVNDSADLSSTNDISVQLDSDKIIIHHENFSHTLCLDYLWLRDFCKCADCYDCAKHVRLFDVTDFPLKLCAKGASLFQDNILIEWNDRHVSKYVISELLAQHKPQKSKLIPTGRLPWSAKQTQGANFQAMSYNDLISDNGTIKAAFKRLQGTGVLLIKDISANAQQKPFMLELLLRRLFPHNAQNHLKEERSNFNNSQPLPHTNCTFLSESCGLQILSLNPACALEMAQLNIVDGLNAVQVLSQNSCHAFDYLTQYKIPLIYQNAQKYDYHTEASIIKLSNGEVERIKFAPYQRGNMPQDMQQFTDALRQLTSIIKQQQLQWPLCLSSDMLIILDNWRICWQVENMESKIALDCIYMERKEFLSQLHCLQCDSLE